MNCAICGKPATKINAQGAPACSTHARQSVKAPECPNCKVEMTIRKGKFGSFWGCKAFPMCDGIRKI
ncbi:MAG: topoisomerase DNA-binding C4 zinc finger domain-containing protein [Candidatus Diapherotrites archaeon]|nr:topoisomerase DNA-binding C4 zinc finger domain-containing protein [Candidatus Diapherotrites archaeon]